MRTVLFLGVANSTRTQMAEAILRHRAGNRFKACSAGLSPLGVHPFTRRVLTEVGVDTGQLVAKSLRSFLGRTTVEAAIILSEPQEADSPRIYPFALQVLRWPFENPALAGGDDRERLNAFRRVRDAIDRQIQDWMENEAARKAELVAVFQPRIRSSRAVTV